MQSPDVSHKKIHSIWRARWWDSVIDPDNQYYHYDGIAHFIVGEDLDKQNYQVALALSLLHQLNSFFSQLTLVPQPKVLSVSTAVAMDVVVSPVLNWGVTPPAN